MRSILIDKIKKMRLGDYLVIHEELVVFFSFIKTEVFGKVLVVPMYLLFDRYNINK